MSILWETGLGSCLVIVIGCAAAGRAIFAKKKPGAVTPGRTNN